MNKFEVPDHKVIYLIPDGDGTASWCSDPAPGIDMNEEDAIKYVRADSAVKLEDVLNKARLIDCNSHMHPYSLRVKFLTAIKEAFDGHNK